MPKVSNRQDTLKWVRENLYLSVLRESSDSDNVDDSESASSKDSLVVSLLLSESDPELDSESDSDAEIVSDPTNLDPKPDKWLEMHFMLDLERFWVKRSRRFQAKEFSETFFYEEMPEYLFRQITRMNREPFRKLVCIIEFHSVFHNISICHQAPVALQLAVCLDRLGHSGNGACLRHALLLWGISVGSCVNFTRRCITALKDCIGDILKWPTAEERLAIKARFALKGFPNCVGLIDGTTLPLAQKPAQSGEVYYERKARYSINAQVVCDDQRRIMFLYSGPPGSCSDLTCLKRSALWDRIHGQSLFADGEYVLADSGYVNAPHMVCAYKMTLNSRDRIDFNYCIAKCRVINEHCIGVLKNRWYSLKEIRLQLNKNSDHGHLCRWIVACALLHNYVHDQNDLWTAEDMELYPMEPTVEIPADAHQNRGRSQHSRTAGGLLLEIVRSQALEINRALGGCLWAGGLI